MLFSNTNEMAKEKVCKIRKNPEISGEMVGLQMAASCRTMSMMSRAQKDIFNKQKSQCLDGVDLSKKGSVDAPIQPLIQYINDQTDYFTTSSCSGRIMVVENADQNGVKKKGCKWIFSSHDKITFEELRPKLDEIKSEAVFKFEPFVLHVQCRSLSDAQYMMSCGITSGYRNSGISVSTKGKCIVAIRSTHSLEVPLSQAGQLLVSDEYLSYLVKVANQKMEENFSSIARFFSTLKAYMKGDAYKNHQEAKKQAHDQNQSTQYQSQMGRRKKQSHVESIRGGTSVIQSKSEINNTADENIDDICDLFGELT